MTTSTATFTAAPNDGPDSPDRLLKEGRVADALQALTAQVKQHPADAGKRVFLFQLLALLGQWARAENQLKVAGELDAQNALMVTAYQLALRGERERAEVFAGRGQPVMIGEPSAWQAMLLQALRSLNDGRIEQALALRAQAFEEAQAASGSIDGTPFEWIADADPRLGPCLELILDGRYAWVPFSRIATLRFEAPTDLRDKVWAPVQISWRNGGNAIGFVPCRYDGTEQSNDAQLLLARRTEWVNGGVNRDSDTRGDADSGHNEASLVGRGQRMFVTDAGEYALLDVRTLTFDAQVDADVDAHVDAQ